MASKRKFEEKKKAANARRNKYIAEEVAARLLGKTKELSMSQLIKKMDKMRRDNER